MILALDLERTLGCMLFTYSEVAPLSPNDLLTNNRAVMGYSLSSLSRSAPHVLASTARKALNLIINGEIRIDITCTLPLEQAAEAHRLIESRGSTGKLVLRV